MAESSEYNLKSIAFYFARRYIYHRIVSHYSLPSIQPRGPTLKRKESSCENALSVNQAGYHACLTGARDCAGFGV